MENTRRDLNANCLLNNSIAVGKQLQTIATMRNEIEREKNQPDVVNGEDRSNEKPKWNRLLLLLVNRLWPVVHIDVYCFYAQTD